ncbi:PIG-L family deacetylase [Kineosporia rhizophila]|uniref:PIG-L deacetylase family protein n=1 Tax=Kineosporia TaxID=49184 RepID=UPI001E45FE71|nr:MULTISPECIES: PIG-L family deacetylase [Kineosporia]MCE0539094.1 PIG-L family deacetylase [Kineosporia rhizophila]GLY17804.1 PIG-L family deacetylase [Kineosporia sp. NBRC 101677]
MTDQLPAATEVTAPGLPPSRWRPRLEAAPSPRLLPVTAGDPVTVIAPHPDDESLGAGGLLHRLSTAGCTPTVVIVTDGAAGYPGATPTQRRELARSRRRETWDAIRQLCRKGAQPVFFDIPDGEASAHEAEVTERIAAVLPGNGLVLAPWPEDPHPDHQAVGRAARLAAARTGVELWQYPIWMRHSIQPDDPRVPLADLTVVCLSTAERQAKRRAIEAHASQLRSPFPDFGPVLPEHVLELFADGLEPFFVPRNS